MGSWVFGCDVCQTVCPYNRAAPEASLPDLVAPPRRARCPWRSCSRWTSQPFVCGSGARRSCARRSGLVRNACVAAGNSGDPDLIPRSCRSSRTATRSSATTRRGPRPAGGRGQRARCAAHCRWRLARPSARKSPLHLRTVRRERRTHNHRAGAAGLMAAIFAAQAAQPPGGLLLEATDKPGQRSSSAAVDAATCCPACGRDRLPHGRLAQHGAQDPRCLATGRGDDLLRARPPRAAGAGGGQREVLPASNRSRTVLDALLRRPRARRDPAAAARGSARSNRRTAAGPCGSRRVRRWRRAGWCWRPAACRCPRPARTDRPERSPRSATRSSPPTRPSFRSRPIAATTTLTGISLPVTLSAGAGSKRVFQARGGFLFTHRGYSGPRCWTSRTSPCARQQMIGQRTPISVQWTDLGAIAWDALLRSGRSLLPCCATSCPNAWRSNCWSRQGSRRPRARSCAARSHPAGRVADATTCRGPATRVQDRGGDGGRHPAERGEPGHAGKPSRGACTCAARCWMRSARSADSISSGRG